MRRWRLLLIPCVLLPGGCGADAGPVTGYLAAATAGSVVVFGRGPGDLIVSAVTGRDCSIVRLDQGRSYCRPVEPPPEPPAFCTRSIGDVDCWANPQALPGNPHPIADGPAALTPEQEANRTHRWPDLGL